MISYQRLIWQYVGFIGAYVQELPEWVFKLGQNTQQVQSLGYQSLEALVELGATLSP